MESYSLDNSSQTLLSSLWVGSSPCKWVRITCDEAGSVTNLSFAKYGLRLRGDNQLSGHLPNVCLGVRLAYLGVLDNNLTGQIPPRLRDCKSLYRVRLGGNRLTGNISQVFGIYPNLNYISISNNRFYGEHSPKRVQCHNLILSNNKISGKIPTELKHAAQLQELNLSSSPKEFGALMYHLLLSGNQLSVRIPSEIGLLSNRHRSLVNLESAQNY
ncbi:hypothetical protein PTKIN_Ptkin01aG0252000 [Pterospermum kingtungense]